MHVVAKAAIEQSVAEFRAEEAATAVRSAPSCWSPCATPPFVSPTRPLCSTQEKRRKELEALAAQRLRHAEEKAEMERKEREDKLEHERKELEGAQRAMEVVATVEKRKMKQERDVRKTAYVMAKLEKKRACVCLRVCAVMCARALTLLSLPAPWKQKRRKS